jgi:preprotein translocase subunit SecG
MQTFITIIFVIVALMMVLSILLQAGKGGGLGSALGGGASQSVFGGGGSGDFMAKLTQGFAATFMICAMYLAYASAHAGSDFLEGQDTGTSGMLTADQEINYERIGPNPQALPTPEEGKLMQAKATAMVPAQSEATPEPMTPAPGAAEPTTPEPGAAEPTAPEPDAAEPTLDPSAPDDAAVPSPDQTPDPEVDPNPVSPDGE